MSQLKQLPKRLSHIALVALVSGLTWTATNLLSAPHAVAAKPTAIERAYDVTDAEARAAWRAWRFADFLGATPEQKIRLIAVAKDAAKDIFPHRAEMMLLRKQMLELLRQPAVNREAIEKVREQVIANIDAASKRRAQALADMGEVLTPEQRKNLAEDISFVSRHLGRAVEMRRSHLFAGMQLDGMDFDEMESDEMMD